ncbi:MAG: DUF2252 domain-containing protein [Microthrixaceae bacterium]
MTEPAFPTPEERREYGRARRSVTPRSSLAEWSPGPDRPDPVELIAEQNVTRVPWLVPVRHARMQVSAFTFYRGAARIMAADLARTPVSGIEVQLAGDAHLANFGAYASPERKLVFDQNDFDETLPGPWEFDLKRLAASFVVASRFHGFTAADGRAVAAEAARVYRVAMQAFGELGFVDLWYDVIDVDHISALGGLPKKTLEERLARFQRKAEKRTSLQALAKLAETVDGTWRIRSDPPYLVPLREIPDEQGPDALMEAARSAFEQYKDTIDDARHALLDRYEFIDAGIKVVGVGSVGTRCLVLLLRGRDEQDPLFLQVKEADASVLEEHLAPSRYDNHGQRVVEGQRLVQAQSDIFLGWTRGPLQGVNYYVRQLRDWKGSVDVEAPDMTPAQLGFYARLCGMTLARGHARSGDAVAIAAYCGRGTGLDTAIAAFADAYADQNDEDYARFRQAIADGRLPAAPGDGSGA